MNKQQQTFVINALRRASFKWRPRNMAKNAAKVQIGEFSTGRPKYGWKCAMCGEIFKAKDTQMDHVDPVVPLGGFESGKEFDMEEFVERLLVYEKGWQCICCNCHQEKSKWENDQRREHKKLVESTIKSLDEAITSENFGEKLVESVKQAVEIVKKSRKKRKKS